MLANIPKVRNEAVIRVKGFQSQLCNSDKSNIYDGWYLKLNMQLIFFYITVGIDV